MPRLKSSKNRWFFFGLSSWPWCKHVHRLELQKFFNFCAAHSPVRLHIETKFLISNYCSHVKNKKYGNFVSISSLTDKCAAQKLKNCCSSSLWTCFRHMVILISYNKIIDFCIPRPTKWGRGVLASPRMSVRPAGRPSVRPASRCPHFVSGVELGNPCMDFFNFWHTHPLGGVDVPFGFFLKLYFLNWPTIGHN